MVPVLTSCFHSRRRKKLTMVSTEAGAESLKSKEWERRRCRWAAELMKSKERERRRRRRVEVGS